MYNCSASSRLTQIFGSRTRVIRLAVAKRPSRGGAALLPSQRLRTIRGDDGRIPVPPPVPLPGYFRTPPPPSAAPDGQMLYRFTNRTIVCTGIFLATAKLNRFVYILHYCVLSIIYNRDIIVIVHARVSAAMAMITNLEQHFLAPCGTVL